MNVAVLSEGEDEETNLMIKRGRVSRGRGTRERGAEGTNWEERTEEHRSPKAVLGNSDSVVFPLDLVVLSVSPKT